MIDQRSRTEFSIGVPVSTKRCFARRANAACAFCVSGFLMCCASSSTAVENFISRNVSMSRLRIRRYVAAGNELLQRFTTIGDGGAKLARRLFDIPGVGAVDAVKPGLRLRRIAIANDLFEILQSRGVDHREVAIL